MYKRYVKRAADAVAAAAGLVSLSPLLLALTAAVKLDDPGPAFFSQERIGAGGRHFKLYKFRSMKTSTPRDMPTHLLAHPEEFITKVGAFLRKSSLDELPQLWNILKGEMAFVGPRPALYNQDDLIELRRLNGSAEIRPGLTGWAQINGRDELSVEEKAKFDGEYAERLNSGSVKAALFDIRCLAGTLIKAAAGDGVSEGGPHSEKNGQKTVMVLSSHTHSLFWFRVDMMRAFTDKNCRVVAVGQEPESVWRDKFAEYKIEYRSIFVSRNGVNPADDLRTCSELKKLIAEIKPDKIFCYQAKTVIYGCAAARMNGVREVYPLIAGIGSVFLGGGFKNKIVRTVLKTEYRIALGFARKIMFQNSDDLRLFCDSGMCREEKCRIINGSGVDTSRFVPTPMPEKTAFLCISRLIADKGVGEYLAAAREIRQKYPSVRCMLVGPFDTNPSAITSAQLDEYISDGSVEYYGEQSDVRPYIEQCCVFVLPSYHEGTPKTVLEAMSCGRAVITTDAPGCRETVANGVNGLRVPVKDTAALCSAMEKFILGEYSAAVMGAEGRKIAVEKYDVKKVNADICEIMEI